MTHHKRHTYGRRECQLIQTVARRVATIVHLAGLRTPLLDTVERVGEQAGQKAYESLAIDSRQRELGEIEKQKEQTERRERRLKAE